MGKVEIGYEKNEEACLREDLLIPNSSSLIPHS